MDVSILWSYTWWKKPDYQRKPVSLEERPLVPCHMLTLQNDPKPQVKLDTGGLYQKSKSVFVL